MGARLAALTCFGLWMVAAALAQNPESPETLLGEAIHKQEAEGDLESAIAAYQRLLQRFPNHRRIAARAQLRLADCYRQLNRPEAASAYRRVISDYGDQPDLAAQARTRLAALRPAAREVVNRRVFALPHYGYFGGTSPDGRYVTYFELAPKRRGLVLRDLASGTERLLSERGFAGRSTVFSPDSKVVAFQGFNGVTPQLRLVHIDGTRERVLLEDPALVTLVVQDWSGDGKEVLATLSRRDRTVQLARVSAATGAVRVVKTFDAGAQAVARVSPDSDFIAYTVRGASPGTASAQDWEVRVIAADGSLESEIASHPARDLLVGWRRDRGLIFVSERRGRPELWAVRVAGGKAQGGPELIPRQIPEFSSLMGMSTIALTRGGSLHYSTFREQEEAQIVELDSISGMVKGDPRPLVPSAQGSTQLPVFSPDGRRIAVLASVRGSSGISVVSTEGLNVERSIPLSGFRAVHQILWAQDGQSFFVEGEDGSLRRGIHHLGGGEVTLAVHLPAPGARVAGFAVEPSTGSVLILKAANGEFTLTGANPAGGVEAVLHSEKYDKRRWGSLSPSGRRMLLFTFNGPAVEALDVVDLPEKRTRRIPVSPALRPSSDFVWAADDRSVVLIAGPVDNGGESGERFWRLSLEDGSRKPLGDVKPAGRKRPVSLHPSGAWMTLSATTTIAEYWVTEPLDLR